MTSPEALENVPYEVLQRMADALRISYPNEVSREDLISMISEAQVDAANDYSGEVPTAAERSPSLLEGRK